MISMSLKVICWSLAERRNVSKPISIEELNKRIEALEKQNKNLLKALALQNNTIVRLKFKVGDLSRQIVALAQKK